MKERPIILNTVEVRAVLKGRLKQIWRPVKLQPKRAISSWTWNAEVGEIVIYNGKLCKLEESSGRNKRAAGELYPRQKHCPFGDAGTRLWVRETWYAMISPVMKSTVVYRADYPDELLTNNELKGSWFPAIYMPRWASRLTLEVTDVRVEQVQNVSEEDAMAAGVEPIIDEGSPDYVTAFRVMWDKRWAKRGFGWDKNPWVWVVEVKRIEKEEVRDER